MSVTRYHKKPNKKNQIKSSLKKSNKIFIILANTLSGVTSERCPSPRLCARAHTSKVAAVASRWQRVGDLIG